jgi:hypothetical protein
VEFSKECFWTPGNKSIVVATVHRKCTCPKNATEPMSHFVLDKIEKMNYKYDDGSRLL